DEARGDDRERAAPLVIPRAAEEPAGLLHRAGVHAARENTAASALLVVVRAAHARDRVAEDDGVVADLDEALGPLEAGLRDRDVVRRIQVARRGDDFARDRPLHVRHLHGTFVHEEHEDLHVGVVLRDGVRHRLQQERLSGLRGGDDQAALASADRSHEIENASGDLVGRGFHPEPLVGVDRHTLVKLDVLAAIVRGLETLDRENLLDDRTLRAPRYGFGLDEKSVFEVLGLDEELRKEGVTPLREVRLGRDERARMVAVELDDSLDRRARLVRDGSRLDAQRVAASRLPRGAPRPKRGPPPPHAAPPPPRGPRAPPRARGADAGAGAGDRGRMRRPEPHRPPRRAALPRPGRHPRPPLHHRGYRCRPRIRPPRRRRRPRAARLEAPSGLGPSGPFRSIGPPGLAPRREPTDFPRGFRPETAFPCERTRPPRFGPLTWVLPGGAAAVSAAVSAPGPGAVGLSGVRGRPASTNPTPTFLGASIRPLSGTPGAERSVHPGPLQCSP